MAITSLQYRRWPMGMISVLLTLKQAPDAMHHLFKMDSRSVKLSNCDKKTVVSSAKRVVISLFSTTGILKPFRFESLNIFVSGSMAISNNRHDMGSPCWPPQEILKGELKTPLTITLVSAYSRS